MPTMDLNDNSLAMARLAGPTLDIARMALENLKVYRTEIEKLEKAYPNNADLGEKLRIFIRENENK